MARMQYRVVLTATERHTLQALLRTNATSARTAKRAHALLLTDRAGPAWPDAQVAIACGVAVRTVCRVRQDWTERGLAALQARPRPTQTPPKLDDEQTARLLALAAGPPPPGYATWSLRLLARQVVALQVVETCSHETVRRTLKKTGPPWARSGAG
jgi:transposase